MRLPRSVTLDRPLRLGVLLGLLAVVLGSCQSLYYDTWEKLGRHKRDLLVSRVEDGRDQQQEAKEQFQSALERFTEVVGFEGGDLQDKYDTLNREYERCRDQADDVRKRIASIEDVAEALFDEWESELEQYDSTELRLQSEEQLRQTEQRYGQLIGAMQRAAAKMDPVLVVFGDQVLFLKHNLNAQAIASLQGQVVELESDIAALVADMEAAIAEADAFIATMGQPS